MSEFEEIPDLPGVSVGVGGHPDSGEWTVEEIFERGQFTGGEFNSMSPEEDVISLSATAH